MPRRLQRMLCLPVVSIAAACGPVDAPTGTSPTVAVPFVPEVSINEVMVGQMDHAARFIFDLGTNPDQQLLANTWIEVEHHAIQLAAATSALTMGGSGGNDATWVAQPDWRAHTQRFNDAALAALQAARNQDLLAVRAAAEVMAEACDSCHQQYKPEIPTQGFYRDHVY